MKQHVFLKNVGFGAFGDRKNKFKQNKTIGVFQHHTKDQKRNPRRLSVLLLALYF